MLNRLGDWVPKNALKNVSILTAGRFFSYGAGFLYGVFGAWILGADGFGQLVLIMALVRMASMPINFQLGSPVLKLVKERLSGNSDRRIRDYVRVALLGQGIGVVFFGIVLLLLVIFAAPWIPMFQDWQMAVAFFGLAEVFQILRKFVPSLLLAYEKFSWKTSLSIWSSLCRDFLTVGFMYWEGVQGACLGYLLGELLILGYLGTIASFAWETPLRTVLFGRIDDWRGTLYELYRNVRSNYVSRLLGKTYDEVTHLVIGGFVGSAGVGYYNIALKFKKIFGFMVQPVTSYLFPRFVEKWSRESHEEFFYTFRKYFYQLGPMFLATATVLAVVAPWVVPFLYSRDFVESVPLVMMLVPAFAVQKLFGIFNDMTFVVSQQRALVVEALFELFLALPVAFLLIYQYGYRGAAWALIVRIGLTVGYQLYFFYQNFGWRWIVPR